MFSELARQLVHIGALAVAGALRYLDWRQAAAIALTALLFNLFLLPRVAPQILRPADRRGWSGIHFYPLALLALVLAFPARLDIVAAAWAIMAAGDGCATLAGKRWPGLRLPWNPAKTWAGLLAFLTAACVASVLVGAWVAPGVAAGPDPMFTVWAATAAAICAALVETIPIRLDDNLSVPAAAAGTLALATMIDVDALGTAWPAMAERMPSAIVINVVLALAAVLARSITFAGGVIGTLIGIVIYVSAGGGSWLLLCTSFAFAVTSTHIGRARKLAAGIAEDRGGRRGAGNALANCLVGAVGAGLIAAQLDDRMGALVLVAGLTAGASDTVASEIGKAFGGSPRALFSRRRVPPGTPGAVSVVGTVAGLVAATAMAIVGVALPVPGFEMTMIGAVVIGATAGAFAESALASCLEPRGLLNNDTLNFLNTAVASAVAIVVA